MGWEGRPERRGTCLGPEVGLASQRGKVNRPPSGRGHSDSGRGSRLRCAEPRRGGKGGQTGRDPSPQAPTERLWEQRALSPGEKTGQAARRLVQGAPPGSKGAAEPDWSPGLPGSGQHLSCGSCGRPARGLTWALPWPSWAPSAPCSRAGTRCQARWVQEPSCCIYERVLVSKLAG